MLPALLQGTEEEILTSPICTRDSRTHSGKFKWAEGIMHSGMIEDPLPGSNAHSEFGIPEFTGVDLSSICDITAVEPMKAHQNLVLPILSQPRRPKRRPIRIPCVCKPFASFEATELAVHELRATLRRIGRMTRSEPLL